MTTQDNDPVPLERSRILRDRLTRLRPLLVGWHVLAVVLLALPLPKVSDADLSTPSVQSWFRRTAADLRRLGLPATSEGLQDLVVAPGRAYTAVMQGARKPANLYANAVGAQQSWRMFAGVPARSARLVIEIQEAGAWRAVHVARSAAHPWRRATFDHLRTRTLVHPFASEEQRPRYRRLHKHLLPLIAVDFPEATRVRFAMERVEIPPPEALRGAGGPIATDRFWVVEHEVAR